MKLSRRAVLSWESLSMQPQEDLLYTHLYHTRTTNPLYR